MSDGKASMKSTGLTLQSGKITSIDDMTPEQRVTLARIQNEPTSIMPPK